MRANREDSFNVMTLSLLIIFLVMAVSLLGLWLLTKDIYLDSYLTLEAFFSVPNTAALTILASRTFSESIGQILPILAIVTIDGLSRTLMISFIIAAVIDFLSYANIEGIINYFKAGMLKNHVILCGYNELTERFLSKLKEHGIKYLVVQSDKERDVDLDDRRIVNIVGDFANGEVLEKAGIARAKAIAFVSEKDVDNVIGCIVARKLNPRIKIMSRITEENIRKKVYGIGADMAVIPEHLAGIEMGEYISKNYGV